MIATGGWDTFALTDIDGILASATEVWLLGQVAFAFIYQGHQTGSKCLSNRTRPQYQTIRRRGLRLPRHKKTARP